MMMLCNGYISERHTLASAMLLSDVEKFLPSNTNGVRVLLTKCTKKYSISDVYAS